jgi:hypothetical protein
VARRHFFIAKLSATRTGTASAFGSVPAYGLNAVGASNVAYGTGFDDHCGIIPDALPSSEDFPGGAISGNVCWSVRSPGIRSLVVYRTAGFGSIA